MLKRDKRLDSECCSTVRMLNPEVYLEITNHRTLHSAGKLNVMTLFGENIKDSSLTETWIDN